MNTGVLYFCLTELAVSLGQRTSGVTAFLIHQPWVLLSGRILPWNYLTRTCTHTLQKPGMLWPSSSLSQTLSHGQMPSTMALLSSGQRKKECPQGILCFPSCLGGEKIYVSSNTKRGETSEVSSSLSLSPAGWGGPGFATCPLRSQPMQTRVRLRKKSEEAAARVMIGAICWEEQARGRGVSIQSWDSSWSPGFGEKCCLIFPTLWTYAKARNELWLFFHTWWNCLPGETIDISFGTIN